MHTAPANIPGSYVHAEAADVSSASQSRNSLSLSLFLFLFLFLSLSLSLSLSAGPGYGQTFNESADRRRIKAAVSEAKAVSYNVYEYVTYSASQFEGYNEFMARRAKMS